MVDGRGESVVQDGGAVLRTGAEGIGGDGCLGLVHGQAAVLDEPRPAMALGGGGDRLVLRCELRDAAVADLGFGLGAVGDGPLGKDDVQGGTIEGMSRRRISMDELLAEIAALEAQY